VFASYHFLHFDGHFLGESGLACSPLALHLSWNRTFQGKGHRFLKVRCPSCDATNTAKALKETVDLLHNVSIGLMMMVLTMTIMTLALIGYLTGL